MDHVPTEWKRTICDWARANHYIESIYIFGSRAKGDHNQNSDLDLGVIVKSSKSQSAFGVWCALAERWSEELQSLLPVQLDFQIGNADISTDVVGPAIADHGIKIYGRDE